jgi:hypothetical protein
MAGTIVRVYCVNGPLQGSQYVDAETGRVLFTNASDTRAYVYHVADEQWRDGRPCAYFDRCR